MYSKRNVEDFLGMCGYCSPRFSAAPFTPRLAVSLSKALEDGYPPHEILKSLKGGISSELLASDGKGDTKSDSNGFSNSCRTVTLTSFNAFRLQSLSNDLELMQYKICSRREIKTLGFRVT